MANNLISGKTLTQAEIDTGAMDNMEFEDCRFLRIDFSNASLRTSNFTECVFEECQLSNAALTGSTFNDVQFLQCKMLGLHFDTLNKHLFSVAFDSCTLDYCSFYTMNLKKTVFRNCSIREADFTSANLSEADFSGSDLFQAKFEQTILEKADLRQARQYTIDPELNKLTAARFSYPDVLALLAKYRIRIS